MQTFLFVKSNKTDNHSLIQKLLDLAKNLSYDALFKFISDEENILDALDEALIDPTLVEELKDLWTFLEKTAFSELFRAKPNYLTTIFTQILMLAIKISGISQGETIYKIYNRLYYASRENFFTALKNTFKVEMDILHKDIILDLINKRTTNATEYANYFKDEKNPTSIKKALLIIDYQTLFKTFTSSDSDYELLQAFQIQENKHLIADILTKELFDKIKNDIGMQVALMDGTSFIYRILNYTQNDLGIYIAGSVASANLTKSSQKVLKKFGLNKTSLLAPVNALDTVNKTRLKENYTKKRFDLAVMLFYYQYFPKNILYKYISINSFLSEQTLKNEDKIKVCRGLMEFITLNDDISQDLTGIINFLLREEALDVRTLKKFVLNLMDQISEKNAPMAERYISMIFEHILSCEKMKAQGKIELISSVFISLQITVGIARRKFEYLKINECKPDISAVYFSLDKLKESLILSLFKNFLTHKEIYNALSTRKIVPELPNSEGLYLAYLVHKNIYFPKFFITGITLLLPSLNDDNIDFLLLPLLLAGYSTNVDFNDYLDSSKSFNDNVKKCIYKFILSHYCIEKYTRFDEKILSDTLNNLYLFEIKKIFNQQKSEEKKYAFLVKLSNSQNTHVVGFLSELDLETFYCIFKHALEKEQKNLINCFMLTSEKFYSYSHFNEYGIATLFNEYLFKENSTQLRKLIYDATSMNNYSDKLLSHFLKKEISRNEIYFILAGQINTTEDIDNIVKNKNIVGFVESNELKTSNIPKIEVRIKITLTFLHKIKCENDESLKAGLLWLKHVIGLDNQDSPVEITFEQLEKLEIFLAHENNELLNQYFYNQLIWMFLRSRDVVNKDRKQVPVNIDKPKIVTQLFKKDLYKLFCYKDFMVDKRFIELLAILNADQNKPLNANNLSIILVTLQEYPKKIEHFIKLILTNKEPLDQKTRGPLLALLIFNYPEPKKFFLEKASIELLNNDDGFVLAYIKRASTSLNENNKQFLETNFEVFDVLREYIDKRTLQKQFFNFLISQDIDGIKRSNLLEELEKANSPLAQAFWYTRKLVPPRLTTGRLGQTYAFLKLINIESMLSKQSNTKIASELENYLLRFEKNYHALESLITFYQNEFKYFPEESKSTIRTLFKTDLVLKMLRMWLNQMEDNTKKVWLDKIKVFDPTHPLVVIFNLITLITNNINRPALISREDLFNLLKFSSDDFIFKLKKNNFIEKLIEVKNKDFIDFLNDVNNQNHIYQLFNDVIQHKQHSILLSLVENMNSEILKLITLSKSDIEYISSNEHILDTISESISSTFCQKQNKNLYFFALKLPIDKILQALYKKLNKTTTFSTTDKEIEDEPQLNEAKSKLETLEKLMVELNTNTSYLCHLLFEASNKSAMFARNYKKEFSSELEKQKNRLNTLLETYNKAPQKVVNDSKKVQEQNEENIKKGDEIFQL